MNLAAAKCAREARDEFYKQNPKSEIVNLKFIAGALGPLNKTLSLSPDVNNPGFRALTFDDAVDAYYEQTKGIGRRWC
jgi:5-methyltetrahydrofolate--homocysteine methyltransferase